MSEFQDLPSENHGAPFRAESSELGVGDMSVECYGSQESIRDIARPRRLGLLGGLGRGDLGCGELGFRV